ncbi:hypothetical protein HJC23_013255 [Cyclotella cryptica]|uniref:Uncharacterized protein n=1 Tax=Cyclotella cryptica TaxID=29204 RepID=A0ABD3PFJ4_9STRA
MKSQHGSSLLLPFLLASLQPSAGREYSRRRLGRAHDRQQQQQQRDHDSSLNRSSFYDLSPLSQEEKLRMIQTAISVTKLGDSIDWDEQKDKFREAVFRDLGGGRNHTQASRDQMSDDETADTEADAASKQEGGEKITEPAKSTSRHLQSSSKIDGDVFDQYEYDTGACPDAGSLGVPCAPDNLAQLCNKYDRDEGSFRECFQACGPAFCCIHDADRELNYLAPNCNTDENCPGYNWCYIAWWKMHDTIGPALFLRLEQDDNFYDIAADEIAGDVTNDPVYTQILLHHFDDIEVIINDGTVDNEFNADRIFLDPEYWDTDI